MLRMKKDGRGELQTQMPKKEEANHGKFQLQVTPDQSDIAGPIQEEPSTDGRTERPHRTNLNQTSIRQHLTPSHLAQSLPAYDPRELLTACSQKKSRTPPAS